MAIPCHSQWFESNDSRGVVDCETDEEKVLKYMEDFHMLYLFNDEKFMPDSYGEERFLKTSVLRNSRFNAADPHYQILYTDQSMVTDEIEFVQWGQEDDGMFQTIVNGDILPSSYHNWPSDQ